MGEEKEEGKIQRGKYGILSLRKENVFPSLGELVFTWAYFSKKRLSSLSSQPNTLNLHGIM